jgi:hypothetical protein
VGRNLLARAHEAVLLSHWRIQMIIPSVLARGEEFSLRLTAFAPDGLPSAEFDREIVFQDSPGVEGLPKSVRLSAGGDGRLTIDGLQAVGPDYTVVTADVEASAAIASNPAWVEDAPAYRIFWGDLHVHSTYSNCCQWSCQDPEFAYWYARDVTHLDFAAVADHLRGIAADERRWPRLQQLVRQYDAPGRFVPFLAFESSHKSGFGGDNNAYLADSDAPYFWADREDMRGNNPAVPLNHLWRFLDAVGEAYFTAPHHTGRSAKYRSFADPVYDLQREPLFEIFSAWGSSESRWSRFPLHGGNTDEPAYFVDALKAGCRYGVIASSDDHCTMPGGERRNWGSPLGPQALSGYHHQGLAALRAKSLSRESLWTALTGRDCYGTTFARTLLDLRIEDVHMGQEMTVPKRDPLRSARLIRVRITTADLSPATVTLVRNGQEIASQRTQPEAPVQDLAFADSASLESVAIRNARFHPDPFTVYYVRVEGAAGQTQWSSPIWLDL